VHVEEIVPRVVLIRSLKKTHIKNEAEVVSVNVEIASKGRLREAIHKGKIIWKT